MWPVQPREIVERNGERLSSDHFARQWVHFSLVSKLYGLAEPCKGAE